MRGYSSVWLERYVDIVEVVGSSPINPTISCGVRNDALVLNLQYVDGSQSSSADAGPAQTGWQKLLAGHPPALWAGVKTSADGTPGL